MRRTGFRAMALALALALAGGAAAGQGIDVVFCQEGWRGDRTVRIGPDGRGRYVLGFRGPGRVRLVLSAQWDFHVQAYTVPDGGSPQPAGPGRSASPSGGAYVWSWGESVGDWTRELRLDVTMTPPYRGFEVGLTVLTDSCKGTSSGGGTHCPKDTCMARGSYTFGTPPCLPKPGWDGSLCP